MEPNNPISPNQPIQPPPQVFSPTKPTPPDPAISSQPSISQVGPLAQPSSPPAPTDLPQDLVPSSPSAFEVTPMQTPAVTPEPAPLPSTGMSLPSSDVPSQSPELPLQPASNAAPTPAQPSMPAPTQYQSSAYVPPGQPIQSFNTTANMSGGRGGRKKFAIAGGATAFVMLLTAGLIFGYYLPNKPQNVWKTGLNRSGKAIDALVVSATEKDKLESYKQSEITATLEATSADYSYSGSFNTKFDSSKADGGLDVSFKDKTNTEKKLNIAFLGELKDGSTYPNVYLKFKGVKDLGLDAFLPGIAPYEDKWIAIEESYLKSLGATPTSKAEVEKSQITASDVAEVSRAVSSVTRQYVFTADPAKAVFEQKSYEGKEKVDSTTAYHYKASINKDHAKDYCKAAVEKVYATNAIKKVPGIDGNSADKEKAQDIKDCQEYVDKSLDDTKEFDIWVDAKYKLIYKVRFYEGDKQDSYIDVGQKYNGGNSLSLFVASKDAASNTDGKFELETNLKTNQTKGTLTVTNTGKNDPYNVKLTIEAKPYKGDIKIEKPAGAIPIKDILDKLNVNPADLFGSATGSTSAEDSKRQVDIMSIQTQAEAYYAQTGYYPTLSNFNDPKWVTANMSSFDTDALKDPKGTSARLSSSPVANSYAYTAGPSGCDNKSKGNCNAFTLTALLSDGTAYTKTSLN